MEGISFLLLPHGLRFKSNHVGTSVPRAFLAPSSTPRSFLQKAQLVVPAKLGRTTVTRPPTRPPPYRLSLLSLLFSFLFFFFLRDIFKNRAER